MRYSLQATMCLVFVFGISVAGAWKAEFFSEELGCGNADASAQSISLEYSGPDLNDTLIPQLMACLDLGSEIEDPLVNCTRHLPTPGAESTETEDCDGHADFVGKSVAVTDMLFCLGWEQPGCTGDVYYTWTPDPEKQEDGCHPGLRVRSFKCLQ
ncbi:hypothetical protein F5Y14DRAFT_416031 [Nemania sp. NC0429]|nr:hypothetical protein F5Y14DRAFT_416031 [Nemania sp. NC0429]